MSDSVEKQLLVGVDEAGYGPNLGPLLISGTAWLAPLHMDEAEVCEAFSKVFRAAPFQVGCAHVPLGDSKKLYQPSSGLATLEAGLLAMVSWLQPQLVHGPNSTLQALIDATEFEENVSETVHSAKAGENTLPWYYALDCIPVPKDPVLGTNPDGMREIERLAGLAKHSLAEAGIELIDLQCVIVKEPEFNRRVNELDSKGQLLSKTTLGLVANLLAKHRGLPAQIFCDRQGGRKNYLPVLLDAMPDRWFNETLSSNQRCSYHSTAQPPCDIHFSVGGDSFPPTALASMLAKYLRERLMESFNSFWSTHIPGIKPTAGYPLDAKRFRAEMEPTAARLALDSDSWWRSR